MRSLAMFHVDEVGAKNQLQILVVTIRKISATFYGSKFGVLSKNNRKIF
jgi:hypothetical protein